jgi:hypothetical protein
MLVFITGHEVIKTAILASIGAVVSYMVSLVLKWVMKKAGHRS